MQTRYTKNALQKILQRTDFEEILTEGWLDQKHVGLIFRGGVLKLFSTPKGGVELPSSSHTLITIPVWLAEYLFSPKPGTLKEKVEKAKETYSKSFESWVERTGEKMVKAASLGDTLLTMTPDCWIAHKDEKIQKWLEEEGFPYEEKENGTLVIVL
jgi:hypothetical protein